MFLPYFVKWIVSHISKYGTSASRTQFFASRCQFVSVSFGFFLTFVKYFCRIYFKYVIRLLKIDIMRWMYFQKGDLYKTILFYLPKKFVISLIRILNEIEYKCYISLMFSSDSYIIAKTANIISSSNFPILHTKINISAYTVFFVFWKILKFWMNHFNVSGLVCYVYS